MWVLKDWRIRINKMKKNSHVLKAILERTANMSTLDIANKYLFGPLSIKNAFYFIKT